MAATRLAYACFRSALRCIEVNHAWQPIPTPDRNDGTLLVSMYVLMYAMIFWMAIRQQVAITDREFLKSMIPNHAGAI